MSTTAPVGLEMQRLRVLESGLGQYCLHLGRALLAAPVPAPFEFYLPASQMTLFGEGARRRPVRRWDEWLGVAGRWAVWHCLHQDSRYWPRARKTPVVLTVHDLNFLQPGSRPEARERRRRRLQRALDRAAAVVAISRFTASELEKMMDLRQPVEVIHSGNCLDDEPPQRPDWAPGGRFWFALGHIHPKKNFRVLLPLLRAWPELHLVIAGDRRHAYAGSLESEAEGWGVRPRLLLPGPVDNATRVWLYRNCEAFLLPSLAEGFGLPVVEAMSQGAPVFLARRTSLPEIGGDEAFYWHDFEPEAMAAVLTAGLERWRREPQRAERARQWAEQFSWQAAAERYAEIYRRLL